MTEPQEPPRPTTPQERVAARLAAEAAATAASEARDAQRRTRRPIPESAAVFGATIAVAIVAYVAFAVPGAWFPSATPTVWRAGQMSVVRGTGTVSGGLLGITSVDATGTAVVSINTDFRSIDYRTISWDVANVPAGADVRMLWRSDLTPSKLNTTPVGVSGGRLLRIDLSSDPGWIGRVSGVALAIRAPIAQPIIIAQATASPLGAIDVLRERAREWLAFEGWTGTSINGIAGGAGAQDMPLPAFLAAAALVAIGVSFIAYRRARQSIAFPLAAATIFVLAWIVSDLRWQTNLVRQAIATTAQYGGKDWHDKHLAAEDGALFAFIDAIRPKLPATPVRIFIVAEANYFRDRAAYHLYPHNVYFDPYQDSTPPSSALQPGDYVFAYHRRGIQYDAAQRSLRLPDGSATSAEVVAADRGAVLLRIL